MHQNAVSFWSSWLWITEISWLWFIYYSASLGHAATGIRPPNLEVVNHPTRPTRQGIKSSTVPWLQRLHVQFRILQGAKDLGSTLSTAFGWEKLNDEDHGNWECHGDVFFQPKTRTSWWFFPTRLKNMLVKWDQSSPIFRGGNSRKITSHLCRFDCLWPDYEGHEMIGLKRRLKKNGWREKKQIGNFQQREFLNYFWYDLQIIIFPAFDLLSVHKDANGFRNLASKRWFQGGVTS